MPSVLTLVKELAAYEKAINSTKSNKNKSTAKSLSGAEATSDEETSGEKKKPSATLSKALTLQPQTLSRDNSSDLHLSVSNTAGGAPHAPKSRIQPKLNMITEIDALTDISPGNTSEPTSTLSPEDRAAILAKVARVINAPLEFDLPKDGIASDPNNPVEKTASAYERYITQQTKEEMEKKLAESSVNASKKSYRTAAWFAGASLFLLGFWFWRKRNVERSRSYLANIENGEKKKYPQKLEPLLNQDQDIKSTWSDNNLTKEYPGTQTHTVTFEYEPGAAPDTPVATTTASSPSHHSPAFVSREDDTAEPGTDNDALHYKHEDTAPSPIVDPFLSSPKNEESSNDSEIIEEKHKPLLEKKSDLVLPEEDPQELLLSRNKLSKKNLKALQPRALTR